jgi:hypothetical protein
MENNEPKKSNEKTLYLVSGIFFAIFLLLTIIIKATTPSFSISSFVIILSAGLIVYLAVVFGFKWFVDKSKKNEETKNGLAPAITRDEANAKANELLAGKPYFDYFKVVNNDGVDELGHNTKSKVYYIHGEGKFESCKYTVILNMHEPNIKCSVLRNPTEQQIELQKQRTASFPEDTPQVKKSTVVNPSGAIVQVEEPVKTDESKDKDEKKEELK